MIPISPETAKTIADFGEQWTIYRSNDGFYASQELFFDVLGPLAPFCDLRGRRVIDIGSGTGRIVMMLLAAGADHVLAVEPSAAYHVLRQNLDAQGADIVDRTTLLCCRGDEIPADGAADFVFSIGVLHHIPEPDDVVKAAYKAMKPGGKFVVWLYGKEGNELYLALVEPLRKLTKRLPHFLLTSLVWGLYFLLSAYAGLCRWLPLPLKDYLVNVLFRFSPNKRRLVIYDQLNPSYAKYYTKEEAEALLTRNGFRNVKLHHRRGYSWTVIGEKP